MTYEDTDQESRTVAAENESLPATEKQLGYLQFLLGSLTRKQASQLIETLKGGA